MADSEDPQDGDPGNGPGREYLVPWGIVALGGALMVVALVCMGGLWHYWPICESGSSCAAPAVVPSREPQQPAAPRPPATSGSAPSSGPTILAVDPPIGLTKGKERVKLSGGPFRDDTNVTFGGDPAHVILPVQPDNVTVEIPAHVAGPVEITVSQKDTVTFSLPRGFTYVDAPTLSAVQPSSGSSQGCDAVMLVGTGFVDGTRVTFGGVLARSVVVNGPTSLTVTAPPHSRGKVDVGILTGGDLTLTPAAFTYVCPLPSDAALYMMVLLAGALGGTLHAMRSFFMYVGARKLVTSWVPMYLLLPLTGATLALVFFVVIGAGLFSLAGAQPGFGMIGFAALVGMFSTQAAAKLKDIAEGLFAKSPKSTEHLTDPPLSLVSVTPKGLPGLEPADKVTLVGTGFSPGMTVTFGANASQEVTVLSDTQAKARIPKGEQDGAVDVTVQRANKPSATLRGGYTYLPEQKGV
jgi:hypothetical protein